MNGSMLVANKVSRYRDRAGRNALWVLLSIAILVGLPATLSAQVDTAWVRRFNGLGNGHDYAYAIAVDAAGNVHVTGSSGSSTSQDYATVKYDPYGNMLWFVTYDGPGSSGDWAKAIAVDDSGNVYVTGYCNITGTNDDFTTIKYRADGDTAWVRTYDGPAHNRDQPSDLVIDGSGNVYVTGRGDSTLYFADYVTIKYYPDGNTAWVSRYDGLASFYDYAYGIAVDDSGNVYVTGTSVGATQWDYATIKYYPDGDTAWVRRYDGPANYEDEAYAIAVDDAGNVYVTGKSDSAGNYNPDYLTIKYDSNGNTVWASRYDGPGNGDDEAYALAVDDSGNVYVTGYSCGANSEDYATIKYRADGDTAWVRRYDLPGNSYDYAYAIAVDATGNVYVTGESDSGSSCTDYATVKYYPNGDTAWTKRYDGPGNEYDLAAAIVLDDQGNVYVTGWSLGAGTYNDYATIKYVQQTGISENRSPGSCGPSVKIFPNPANSYFSVDLPRSSGFSTIRLFDVSGRRIKEFACTNQGIEQKIPLTGIIPGVYFVQVNDGTKLVKVIITK